jgi:CRP/FNR family transcriptional regulator
MAMVFNQASCAALFEKMPEETFKRGKVIFWNRQSSFKYVYLVTGGMVKISSVHQQKELMEDYFQEGEMLNCQAILGDQPGTLSAVAMVGKTSVRKLPIALFRQAVRSNHHLYEEVLDNLAASLQRTQDRLLRMTLLSANQRVYHFLAKHALHSGRKVGFEYVIKPVPTHQEIGNIAGVGRQTVTTVLNELRREGIIHFNRRYLIVRDVKMLQEMSKASRD